MIIISQDRKSIVNFNIMNIIEIFNNGTKSVLRAENRDDVYLLGTYETEERAKEVLQEISFAYANIEMINIPKINIEQRIETMELISNICYKMPEK